MIRVSNQFFLRSISTACLLISSLTAVAKEYTLDDFLKNSNVKQEIRLNEDLPWAPLVPYDKLEIRFDSAFDFEDREASVRLNPVSVQEYMIQSDIKDLLQRKSGLLASAYSHGNRLEIVRLYVNLAYVSKKKKILTDRLDKIEKLLSKGDAVIRLKNSTWYLDILKEKILVNENISSYSEEISSLMTQISTITNIKMTEEDSLPAVNFFKGVSEKILTSNISAKGTSRILDEINHELIVKDYDLKYRESWSLLSFFEYAKDLDKEDSKFVIGFTIPFFNGISNIDKFESAIKKQESEYKLRSGVDSELQNINNQLNQLKLSVRTFDNGSQYAELRKSIKLITSSSPYSFDLDQKTSKMSAAADLDESDKELEIILKYIDILETSGSKELTSQLIETVRSI